MGCSPLCVLGGGRTLWQQPDPAGERVTATLRERLREVSSWGMYVQQGPSPPNASDNHQNGRFWGSPALIDVPPVRPSQSAGEGSRCIWVLHDKPVSGTRMREGARASYMPESTPGPHHTPMVGSLLCVQVSPHPFSWPLCGWERARLPETHPGLLGWGHLFMRKPPFRNTPGSDEVVRGYVSDTPISPTPQGRRELITCAVVTSVCAASPLPYTPIQALHPAAHHVGLQPPALCSRSRTTPKKPKCWCFCVYTASVQAGKYCQCHIHLCLQP